MDSSVYYSPIWRQRLCRPASWNSPFPGEFQLGKFGKNLNRKTVGLGCQRQLPASEVSRTRQHANMSTIQYSGAIVLSTEWKITGVQKNMRYPQRNEKIGFIFVFVCFAQNFFRRSGMLRVGLQS